MNAPDSARVTSLLADPRTWTEPTHPPPSCLDGANTTIVLHAAGKTRRTTLICATEGRNGEIADLILKDACGR